MSRAHRLPLSDLSAGERTLSSADRHYLTTVLRLGPGESLVVFDPRAGVRAHARIARAAGREIVLAIGEIQPSEPSRPLIWIHALAKGEKMDAIVRTATELGATAIVGARAERSVVDLEGARLATKLDRWARIADQAARQSLRWRTPEIRVVDLERALGDAPSLLGRVILHPDASTRLSAADFEAASGVAFAAGPEGGWSNVELEQAERAGFKARSLRAPVLRTETVPAAILGAYALVATGA